MPIRLRIEAAAATPAQTGSNSTPALTVPSMTIQPERRKELEKLGKTADAAFAAGLAVNAGHDLTVGNLPALAKRIPGLPKCRSATGLTADALEYGMAETVRRFLKACGW